MKTKMGICLMVFAVLTWSASLAVSAEVAQGKCIDFNQEQHIIVLEEYDIHFSQGFQYGHPTGNTLAFDVSKAMIGLLPEPGDILRIAYRVSGNTNLAIKVMNVSKQDLMKK